MSQELKDRTQRFALSVIRFVQGLPKNETCKVIGRQLLRAGTSVGANYRAAARAKSNADFICKMGIVEEEADECCYWIELLQKESKVDNATATVVLKEANELTAIATASINTARGGRR